MDGKEDQMGERIVPSDMYLRGTCGPGQKGLQRASSSRVASYPGSRARKRASNYYSAPPATRQKTAEQSRAEHLIQRAGAAEPGLGKECCSPDVILFICMRLPGASNSRPAGRRCLSSPSLPNASEASQIRRRRFRTNLVSLAGRHSFAGLPPGQTRSAHHAATNDPKRLPLLQEKAYKCDGRFPCERCAARGSDCSYQDRIWRTKDDLRSEISKLQDGVTQVLSLLDAIASGDVDRDAIRRIRQGNTVDSIVRSLGIDVGGAEGQINLQEKLLEIAGRGLDNDQDDADNQSLDSGSDRGPKTADALPSGEHSETRSQYPESSRTASIVDDASQYIKRSRSPTVSPFCTDLPHRTLGTPGSGLHAPVDQSIHHPSIPAATEPISLSSTSQNPIFASPSAAKFSSSSFPSPAAQPEYALDTQWSSMIADSDVVDNIMDTFFTWEYPGYSAVHKESFFRDFKARRRRFCSESLVHAIMARSYQMMECAGTPVAAGLVDGLYRRAESLLTVERSALETPYPYIQTLTILASVDIVTGVLDRAWHLAQQSARLAIMDALAHMHTTEPVDEEHMPVRANTFCAAVSLPCLLRFVSRRSDPMEAPLFMRLREDESETPEARIERGIQLQKHYHASLRHCPPRQKFIWELTELSHTFLMFHFDEPSISQGKKDLFETYPRLLECFEKAAHELGTDNLTPEKLYNIFHYHFAMMLVFKPYIHDQTLEPALSPRMVLANSSRSVIELAWHHKVHWGLGNVHVGFPYILGVATEISVQLTKPSARSIALAEANAMPGLPSSSEIACKGIMCLAELGPFHFAARDYLRNISSLYKW